MTDSAMQAAAPPLQANKANTEARLAFGGPVGAVLMMTLLPVLTLYLWACIHLYGGSLAVPDAAMLSQLPMPSLEALAIIVGWFGFQLLLDVVLPGRDYTGIPQKDGVRRTYRLNGLLSVIVTAAVIGGLMAAGLVRGTEALELLGPLLVTAIGLSYLFGLFLYAFGKREPAPHDAMPKGDVGKAIYNYFMGTGLNPRVGRVDLKMFMESKIAMTSWLVVTMLMAHAEYEKTGGLSLAMSLVCIFHVAYILDFFYFEEAMLSTWDINQENYGYMLAFAFLVWMPFNFSIQSQYLVYAEPDLPLYAVVGLVVLNFFGYYIFRSSNLQKHKFRTKPGTKIWGREPEFIQTKRGTKLLASGWWGLARHCNYLGDLMMALAWCLACGVTHIVPYFYFLYFAPLLIDRERRDDEHCAKKYGDDWDTYRERVPSRIIPYIY